MSSINSGTQYCLVNLPDIILHHVMKYLDPVDLVSFSAAVQLHSVSYFLRRPRSVKLSRRYNMTISDVLLFGLKCNAPEKIRVLDISHCYWIPAEIMLSVLSKMSTLESLDVEGTQLSLIHLSDLLYHCQKISHLSFTLHTDLHKSTACSLDPSVIEQIKSLKIVWFDYANGWRLAIEFLGFCRDCSELDLVPKYQHCDISADELTSIEEEMFPKLRWMDNLISFTCFQKASVLSHDPVMESLSVWMSNKLKLPHIQKFWLGPNVDQSVRVPKTIDSWHAGQWAENSSLIGEYEYLTEIGGVELDQLPLLPNLRLAQGTISDDDALFRFLQRQSKIEHLSVEKDADLYADSWMEDSPVPAGLQMLHLRSLVYTCCRLDLGLMGKLLEMSPHLEQVALDCTDPFHWSPLPIEQLAKLGRLKRLSIEGDGFGPLNSFHQIFTHCKRLESLHVRRKMSYDSLALMQSIVTALPIAKSLQNLSLSWSGDTNLKLLSQIAQATFHCNRLERVHLELRGPVNDHKGGEVLPEIFIQMIQSLPSLVALVLNFDGPSLVVKELRKEIQVLVSKALNNNATSARPSFWFHCNRVDSSSFKCCHYDELIDSCPQLPTNYLV